MAVGRIIQPCGPTPIVGPLVGDPCIYNPRCLLCCVTASATWKLTSLRFDIPVLPSSRFWEIESHQCKEILLFFKTPWPALGPTQLLVQCLTASLSSGGKVAGTWNRLLNSIYCQIYEWVEPCRRFPYIFMCFAALTLLLFFCASSSVSFGIFRIR